MEVLEEAFESACSNGIIPGAVLAAVNKTGSFSYEKSFGVRSLEEGKNAPMNTDTLMTLASCTKIITTIAVLQLVERGQVGLKDDVATVLPELVNSKIITGMVDGKPTLVERKNPISLLYVKNQVDGSQLLEKALVEIYTDMSQESSYAFFWSNILFHVTIAGRIHSIYRCPRYGYPTKDSGWVLQLAWYF